MDFKAAQEAVDAITEAYRQPEKKWRVRARLVTYVDVDGIPADDADSAQLLAETKLKRLFPGIENHTAALITDSTEPRPDGIPSPSIRYSDKLEP